MAEKTGSKLRRVQSSAALGAARMLKAGLLSAGIGTKRPVQSAVPRILGASSKGALGFVWSSLSI